MKKRLQVVFSEEAWAAVEALTNQANENFDAGSINYSDVINEMILSAKVDIKALQLKHTDLRRSLRSMASKEELDLDAVIKSLLELKSKTGKRKVAANETEVA
jgi:hypothetical protein